MGDTCVAMDQWVNNPTAHTALDDIIPCVDADTAQESLSQSKEVTFQMVGLVNGVLSNVSNANLSPGTYNQSGPLVPLLCNPYNPDKTDRKCAAGEVDLSNATQVNGFQIFNLIIIHYHLKNCLLHRARFYHRSITKCLKCFIPSSVY